MKLNFKHKVLMGAFLSVALVSCSENSSNKGDYSNNTANSRTLTGELLLSCYDDARDVHWDCQDSEEICDLALVSAYEQCISLHLSNPTPQITPTPSPSDNSSPELTIEEELKQCSEQSKNTYSSCIKQQSLCILDYRFDLGACIYDALLNYQVVKISYPTPLITPTPVYVPTPTPQPPIIIEDPICIPGRRCV